MSRKRLLTGRSSASSQFLRRVIAPFPGLLLQSSLAQELHFSCLESTDLVSRKLLTLYRCALSVEGAAKRADSALLLAGATQPTTLVIPPPFVQSRETSLHRPTRSLR